MSKRITFRTNDTLYEQLKKLADDSKRSVNAQIEYMIETFLLSHKRHNERYDIKESSIDRR